jgi:hypothetical protein
MRRPGYRILEKQNHLLINARIRKRLDSSATGFVFQGFSLLGRQKTRLMDSSKLTVLSRWRQR